MQLLDICELSIVLVEPSSTQLKLIVRRLADEGVLRVEGVDTGTKALELMRRSVPDLVISAMYLPDMEAIDLLKRMRLEPGVQDVPFMLVSSETSFDALDPLRQAGLVAILPKPFDHDDLHRALRSTIAYIEPQEISLESLDIDALRVLVVDDSPMARKHISRVLGLMGITNITTANNGREAADLFRERLFDLVVTDLNMPDMDGKGLVEHIRGPMGNRSVPILMVTSEQDMARLNQVEQAGVSAICDKPFELQDVKEILYRVLQAA